MPCTVSAVLACVVFGCGAGLACSEEVVARFEFACTSSASCGAGYVCNTIKHRCVPAAQFADVTTSGDAEVSDTQGDVDVDVPDSVATDSQVHDSGAESSVDSAADSDGDASEVSEVSETEVSPSCIIAGSPGCPCERGTDCTAGACIEDVDGPVCATPCESTCADGRECHHPVAGAGGYCVTPHAKLCRPCRTHEECDNPEAGQHGGCAEAEEPGLGGFCATSCLTTACPAGFRCYPNLIGADPGCVPDEGHVCECRDSWTLLGYTTGCSDGDCGGTRRCTASGLGACEGLCDDGLSCTADSCSGSGCSHSLMAGTCLIAELGTPSCFEVGDINPNNTCQICDASRRTTWTLRGPGSQCGSGASQGVCDTGGICVGCNNDNDCESGRCDEASKTCATWPFGDDGDLDVPSGSTVTIAPGTRKDYRNVTIHQDGILRIAGTVGGWAVIGVSGDLVLEAGGVIDGRAALSSNPTGQLTIQAPGPDGTATGETLTWLPIQARGGAGGGASGLGGTASNGNGGGGAGGQEVSGGSCGTRDPGLGGGGATAGRGGNGGTTLGGLGAGGGGAMVSGGPGAEGLSGKGGGGGHRGNHGAMVYFRVVGSVSGNGSITLAGQAGGAGGAAIGDVACTCPPAPKAGCPGGGGAGGNGGKLVLRGSAWPASISVDLAHGAGGSGGANQPGETAGCQCQHPAEAGAAGTDGERDDP